MIARTSPRAALSFPVLTAAALLALSAAACAQDDKAAAREACMADYKKLCTGVMPGAGRVLKCLADNLDKLAPRCREIVIARTRARG